MILTTKTRGSTRMRTFLRAAACILLVLGATPVLADIGRRCAPPIAAYRQETGVAPRARALAAYQMDAWSTSEKRRATAASMRALCPEWDLMARTFLVLALADLALRSPSDSDDFLRALDGIIDDTLAVERAHGQWWFLLPYGKHRPFIASGARSLFVDGEIALMLGVRQIVRPREDYARLLRERVPLVDGSMSASPTLSGESYPDECWTFCNTTALAALRVFDALEGASHAKLAHDWVTLAKARLVEPRTGLLVSSYTYRGRVKDGPEGSSIWMSARNLLLVDEAFARDQFERARRELGDSFLGFAYAREWPRGQLGKVDVDSGPIVPLLDASPSSSGFAILGASAFGDDAYLASLIASLEVTAFPRDEGGKLHFEASNTVGDAVMLSGVAFGPVWDRVRRAASR